MTFSIIIPVYNVAPYLRECLDSLLAQTFTDWEAICVDDGSTDGSGAILDKYAARDGRFRVIHQSNAGVGAARNAALDAARGEWLFFLDSDDVIVSSGLAKLAEIVEDDRYDAVITGNPIPFERQTPTSLQGTGRIIGDIPVAGSGKGLLLGRTPLWGWPVIRVLRTSVFAGVKFPVGVANMEDSLSLLDVLAVKARWLWVDWRVYGYRDREGSACRHITVEKMLKIFSYFVQMHEDLISKLECTRDEARGLMNQYRGSMNYYLDRAMDAASAEEIKAIKSRYDKCVGLVGTRLANRYNRIRFLLVSLTGHKIGFGVLRHAVLWYSRMKSHDS